MGRGSLRASSEGIAKAEKALRYRGLTKKALGEEIEISRSTISNFFNHKNVDRWIFQEICHRLELDWNKIFEKPLISQEEYNLENQSQQSKEKTKIFTSNISVVELSKLLEFGQWKAADRETAKLLLKSAGTNAQSCLRFENLENISCEILQNIDQLWLKNSNNKFGFSIQLRILKKKCRKVKNSEIEKILGHHLKWREADNWKNYNELFFDLEKATFGHLPAFFLSDLCWRYDYFLASLLAKFSKCKL